MGAHSTGAQLLSPPRRAIGGVVPLRRDSATSSPAGVSTLAAWKPEIAIFAVALALRLALFLAVGPWDPARLERRIFVGDARDYHRLALNLVEHGVYSSHRRPPLLPNTFRVPLYPAYLALFYGLFGARPHLAILAQLALGSITCVVLCRAGTRLFGRRAGIAAGAILALDYSAVLFSNRLYADTLFTLLIALSLLAMSHVLAEGARTRSLVAAGVCLGLATLCRPVNLYFVLALLPVLWLAVGQVRAPRRRRLGLALGAWGVLAAAYLVTLAPWMLRNLAVAGRPFVTSIQTMTVEWYLPRTAGAPLSPTTTVDGAVGAPAAESAPQEPPPLATRVIGDAMGFGRGFVRYFAILGSGEYPLILGIPYRRHDAEGLREASLARWAESTLRNRSSPLERTLVIAIIVYLLALYAAAARGAWIALRRGRWVPGVLLLAAIGYFMVSTGPLAREIRYRLPALTAIVLFAGLGVTAPWRTRDVAQISRSSEAPSSRSAA